MDPNALAAWYGEHARDLPWRATSDPWSVLLSEILLQQTQVARGIEYWQRLVERFPTPSSMAEAPLEDVMHLWQGAGYYARGRRLHELAKVVCDPAGPWKGRLPSPDACEDVVKALQGLPGIGPYTAAAVASIAYDLPSAVVDGNVRRVVARRGALPTPSPKHVQEVADRWMMDAFEDGIAPSVWNQAVMELGATLCRPKGVKCGKCPVQAGCEGFGHEGGPEGFPLPAARRVQTERLVAVVDLDVHGRAMLEQRPDGARFGGLWGPIMHEASSEEADKARDTRESVGHLVHHLSHRRLEVEVLLGRCEAGAIDRPMSNLDQRVLELAQAAAHERASK